MDFIEQKHGIILDGWISDSKYNVNSGGSRIF